MPEVIASTYEMIREIGAGGGGTVYLAKHLRLGKQVVLKADKRTLSAKPEALRREVDALKDLSHTYIPQVYDFIEENGTVYTVMDYIEGESFDKPLRRGERFAQPRVVEWAIELLEALCYLHSRPPHGILHGDIKPANIMLTPQGDIRLIDFNIALALGEQGAVKAGFSRGYASPEHYGIDYSQADVTQGGDTDVLTKLTTGVETVVSVGASGSSSASGRAVLLDVRSDIYSLGATLYHILTGERPAQDAREVAPIPRDQYSPALIAAIQRAMSPDPALRFQSAAEMLYAFEHLRESDPRTRRHRRRAVMAAAALAVFFLGGGASAFVGLKQMEQLQGAYALAGYSQSALRAGDVASAVELALQALLEQRGLLSPPYTPQAQKALADALGVYDLSDGFKAHGVLELPSEPFKLALSPDGRTAAAVYAYAVALFDTETGERLGTLPAEPSALSDALFLSDRVLLYAGEGGVRAYDLSLDRVLWSGASATALAVSADQKTAVAVFKSETHATVYDAATGRIKAVVPFGENRQRVPANDRLADPGDNLLALNKDGTLLAVSFENGALQVFDLADRENDIEIYEESEFIHFEGGFSGGYFAFAAANSNRSAFAVIDTVELAQTGGFTSERPFHVQADESGVYLSTDNIAVQLDPETGEQTELAYTDGDMTGFVRGEAYTAAATASGGCAFFDADAVLVDKCADDLSCDFLRIAGDTALIGGRDTPTLRLLKLERHPEAQVFSYDRSYEHDEARLSADGSTVLLFRYDGFRLYGIGGALIAETAIPDAEQVYDQQYRRDERGSRLEVIYNDGTILSYSADTGALLSRTAGEKPDPGLYEEFYTDKLRIEAPLHETPVAYDRATGERLRELEKDAYLTYVTQIGAYVVTEYISTGGDRYGLLLGPDCETLAYLPYLCDIVGEELIFDYPTGDLRRSRVYPIEELIERTK